MSAKLATDTIEGPPSFASAAINSDASGLSAEELQAYCDWLEFNVPKGWYIVDVSDEPSFSWNCKVHGLPWEGGELVTYTIMQKHR